MQKKTSQDMLGTTTGSFLLGIPSGKEGVLYPVEARVISPLGGLLSVVGEQFHVLVPQVWFLDETKHEVGRPVTLDSIQKTRSEPQAEPKPAPKPKPTAKPDRVTVQTPPFGRPPEAYQKVAAEMRREGLKTRGEWEETKRQALEERKARKQASVATQTSDTQEPPSKKKRQRAKTLTSEDYDTLMLKVAEGMDVGGMYQSKDIRPSGISDGQWTKLRGGMLENGLMEQHGAGPATRYSRPSS